MASKLELLVEADRRGLLKGEQKALFDEAVRRGLVSGSSPAPNIQGAADEAVEGVAAQLPDYDGGRAMRLASINPAFAAADALGNRSVRVGMGKALNDYGENLSRLGQFAGEAVGVLGPNDRARMEKQLGANDQAERAFRTAQPLADTVGGMITDAAVSAPIPAMRGTGLMRGAAGALIGGTTVAAGTGVDESPYTNFVLGAGLGALTPVLGKAVGMAVNKYTTKPIQVIDPTTRQFTPEAVAALEKSGVAPEQFVDDVSQKLRERGVSKEMLERFNLFKEMGIEPTLPQVTRMNDDFILQQELRKTSNAVTTRLAEQDKVLSQKLDTMIRSAGGEAADNIDAGNLVAQTVYDRVNQVDEAINQAYAAARQVAGKDKNVRLVRLASKLRQYASQDSASDGLIKAVVGDLQQRGLMDDAMSAQGRRGSVELVEEARKVINALAGEKPQSRSRIARELKEALDADVQAAVGEDVFAEARKMKAIFERSLERGRTTRRDAGKDTLLEMVIDNRSNPDQLIPMITRKSTRAEDVTHLRTFLESGTPEQVQAGRQALAEIKSAVLRDLYSKATAGTGGMNELDVLEFSGVKFRKALDTIGNQKLTALFDADELTLLGNIARIGELRVPPAMTAMGGGPSGRGALAAAGQDVMALVDMGDPQTSAFTRLTQAAFRRVRQNAAERRILNVESQLQRAIPNRVPADQL